MNSKKRLARFSARVVNQACRLDLMRLEDRTVPTVYLGSHYTGMGFLDSGGFVPPDSMGAAGTNSYVQTINQTIRIYTPKATGASSVTDSFSDFWFTRGGLTQESANSELSDPIVVWDDQIQRFIVGDQDVDFSGTTLSAFDIAVSKSADPKTLTSADWSFYKINTTEIGFDADYPGNFGYNHDAFVFTLNMFDAASGDSFIDHVQVTTVDISKLVSGTLSDFHNDVAGAASLRPTVMHDAVAGDPMWFVAEHGDGQSIDVFKMTNVLSNTATFQTTNLTVGAYSTVLPPLQPDGSPVTFNIDSRIMKAAEMNGTLVACHAISNSTGDGDLARWYEIDVSSGTPSLKDEGDVTDPTSGAGSSGTYDTYPGIDINAAGAIGMSYDQSGIGSSQFMSVYITGRTPSDLPGTMETPVLVQAGTGLNFDTRQGDMSAINTDSDGSFWIANEFTDSSNFYGISIANFQLGPSVTVNTSTIATTATTLTITGSGFSPTAANDTVVFSNGAVGTVTAATATSLTVTFSTPPTAGILTAVVTANGLSSGAPVQVATVAVAPTVTPNTAIIATTTASITINGTGFSQAVANDLVVFSNGAVGTVVGATTTAMTVVFSTPPTPGDLTAVVIVNGLSSGAPVQVATVVPGPNVTPNTTTIATTAPTLTITGSNFSPIASDDSVAFNLGAVGTVTAATATSLTVTFTTPPATTGSLTALVVANGLDSGAPVQVATVAFTPTVTAYTALIPTTATSITINGANFDPTAANDTVVFSNGAVGVVTAASATSLTVTFSTPPTLGSLTAVVTVNGLSSGAPVPVATVTTTGIERHFLAQADTKGTVAILDAVTGQLISSFQPFNAPGTTPYKGAMSVAMDDLNGDGIPDLIVATRGARAGKIKVFNGARLLGRLGPSDTLFQRRVMKGYNQGLTVAAGVNSNGTPDIVVGLRSATLTNGAGTIPASVIVFTAQPHNVFAQTAMFHPFTPGYTGGVYVAEAGKGQIAVSSTLSSDVQVWSLGSGTALMTNEFHPFGSAGLSGSSGDGQIVGINMTGTGGSLFATGWLNTGGLVTIDVTNTTGAQVGTYTYGSGANFFALDSVGTTANNSKPPDLTIAVPGASGVALLDPLTGTSLASLNVFLPLTGQALHGANFTISGS
jgi:hypothetical protein